MARRRRRALAGPSLALALLADAAPSLVSEGDDWGWKIDDGDETSPEALDFGDWKGVETEGGEITALDLAGVATPCSSSAAAFCAAASCLPPPGVMPLLLPALKRLSLGGNSLQDLPDDLGGGEKSKRRAGGARASSGSGSRTTRSGGCRRSWCSSPARSGTCPSRSTPWPGSSGPGTSWRR